MAATLAAVQFSATLVCVAEPVSPLTAPGTLLHAGDVVTESGTLCAEVPAESEAASVKLYVVAGDSPVAMKLVLLRLLTTALPFFKTV